VENCGKYQDILDPGFYCLPWPLYDISGRLSVRINQLEITCESKTIDSVFCTLALAVPFRIITEKAYDAHYRLSDPRKQIESHVFDVVRSTVPKMSLDEVFQSKDTIANAVSRQLKVVMAEYGYEIFKTLVIDIRPEESVRQAMNEMNASKRLKVAMVHIADGEYTKLIKDAEAHCEALYLNGVGLSGQRKALVQEISSSFNTGDNINNTEVMNLLLITQYNDMIAAVAGKAGTNLILRSDPAQVMSLTHQMSAYHS
jgi:regulator of protease activity HflC (stomatin/prohibitin superfamily)